MKKPSPECLLSKIRAGINYYRLLLVFDQQGGSQAFIPKINGLTNRTLASQNRDTPGSTCTKKGKFHNKKGSGQCLIHHQDSVSSLTTNTSLSKLSGFIKTS